MTNSHKKRRLHIDLGGLGYYFFFVQLILVCATGIDHVVNSTLYDFGLQFSWEWFYIYGMFFTLFFIAISCSVSVVYWIFSHKPSKYLAFLLGFTIFLEWTGGFLDLLWFGMEGRLPGPTAVWWWMPFVNWLGLKWTTFHQVLWTLFWLYLLIGLWLLYYFKIRTR
jgi:hypothetical protein